MSSHGSKQAKQITLTWGHPQATYGGDGGQQIAKVYFVPAAFEEFRDTLIQKCSGERPTSTGSVQYQDDDGDWVPMESQAEYDEARRYLYRSRLPVPLRVTFVLEEGRCRGSSKAHCSSSSSSSSKLHKDVKRSLRKFQKEMCSTEGVKPSKEHKCWSSTSCPAKECSKLAEKQLKSKTMPSWFEKYMQKFKAELLVEMSEMMDRKLANANIANDASAARRPRKMVTLPMASVVSKLPTPILQRVVQSPAAEAPVSVESVASTSGSSTRPKVLEMDEVAEPLLYVDLKSQRVLKKMTKANLSERKLSKLNSKLEQLEVKRARLQEWCRRKNELAAQATAQLQQAQPTLAAPPPVMSPSETRKSHMDATVLEGGTVSEKSHVAHSALFNKTWRVLNTGNVAWDDKTEVRLAWLTQGLKPLDSCIKCPPLQPGEEGEISIKFQAPDFAGLFESYWHFYQDDVRFGQWMGCAVIVDPKPSEVAEEGVAASPSKEATTPEDVSVGEEATSSATAEDRGEYESDPEENNHSENENGSDSDSEESDDDSESFVHVPMPQCYQYQAVPLFNIPVGSEDEVSLLQGEDKEMSAGQPGATPPTTPREPESEEEEELFEEASSSETHEQQPTEQAAATSTTSALEAEKEKAPSPPVHILPDNLLTGAINMAARALNASEAIMKTLQGGGAYNIPPQPQVESPVATPSPAPITSQPSSPSSLFPHAIPLPPPPTPAPGPPSFTSPLSPELQVLRDMGFSNSRLNASLLVQHNNNLDQVVSELLSLDGR